MTRTSPRRIAAPLLLLWIGSISAASELPEHARYFSHSFAAVFDDLREFHQLGMVCKTTFAADCGRALDAKVPGFEENMAVIDLITTFRPEKPGVSAQKFSRYEDALALLEPTRKRFMRDLFAYETDFFKRYGAIADVCPHKDLRLTILAATDVDYLRYWSLSGAAYWGIKQELSTGIEHYERTIRGRWSTERCVRTRELGRLLMAHMKYKLKPFAREGWEKLTSKDRFAEGIGFVVLVAIALEAEVRPEVLTEADKILGSAAVP